ncbi:alpha/beta hydrolase [Leisingera aquaemixtae]|uniref:COG3904 family protein n=1 Tax=Leisingera aquaemixtae TaxID=1396826 RepID=UPI001C983976|nr:alpha/beta hydrolase [Leisingera aquaemixtae]MBY6065809.1 alpha/beta hydrolase [Leisingera aquaemixtae]
MRRRFSFLAAGPALAAALWGCGIAENLVQTTRLELQGRDVLVNGTLNARSLAQFSAFMSRHPEAERLVLLDMPGSVDDETNLRLGHLVRDLGLDTHVTATSEIYSGAVDIFLAGRERTMEDGAILGVHAWAGDKPAGAYPPSHPEHAPYVAYTTRMLGSDDFYWFTIQAAPASDIHEMTEAEVNRYGLLTKPVLRD